MCRILGPGLELLVARTQPDFSGLAAMSGFPRAEAVPVVHVCFPTFSVYSRLDRWSLRNRYVQSAHST
ncbi:hypothetical protein EMIT048CA2_50110 [Pseudomonas chlororaphis]